MQKCLLTLCALLVAIFYSQFSYATGSTDPCEKSSSYFRFNYKSAVRNVDNTVTLTFEIKNTSNKSFSYAAFELPDGATAISPALKYTSAYSYDIHNGTNYPFESIKFKSDNATNNFKNGASDVFVYTISAIDFDKLTTIRVKAVAENFDFKEIFVAKACNYQIITPPPAVCTVTPEDASLYPSPIYRDIKFAVDGQPVATIAEVKPGKKLQVCFKVPASTNTYTYSLVSYTAPSAVYSSQTAAQQVLFDSKTIKTNGGSEVCMEINVPNCYYQVDLVKGCVIKQLGPAGSSNFYGSLKRLIAHSNGGSVSCINITPPPPPVVCDKTDKCFDFSYKGTVLSKDGKTVTLTFKVKTNCDRDLSNVAFELPSGATANNFTSSLYNYKTEITNNPFRSIKFEGVGINGYKNGVTDEFKYTMSKLDFDKMTSIRVQAKAATTVGQVTFDAKGCNNDGTPTCVLPEIELVGPEEVSISEKVPVNYTINVKKGSDLTFTWSVPSDWIILSDINASSILVKVGRKKGSVSATATNTCGIVTKSIMVELVKSDDVDEDHNKDCGKWTNKEHDKYCDKDHGKYCDISRDKDHHKYCKKDHDNDFAGGTNKGQVSDKNTLCEVSPNPVTNGKCIIKINSKESSQIQILDYLTGRTIHTKTFPRATTTLTINTQSLGMKKGMYILVCKTGKEEAHSRLVVQ